MTITEQEKLELIRQYYEAQEAGPKAHLWECPVCGHTVIGRRMPGMFFWSDGHCCRDWVPKD